MLTAQEVGRDPALIEEWQRRAESSPTIYRLYHSPVWWEHLRETRGTDALRLIVVREGYDGRICAIVPGEVRSHHVVRHIGGHAISLGRLQVFDLLGSEPLADPSDEVFRALVEGLWRAFPKLDSCRCKSLSTTSPFWQFFNGRESRGAAAVVAPDGAPREFHSIDLAGGWKTYLTRFSSKQRNDLQRKERLLAQSVGPVTYRRVISENDVERVHPDLERVATRARFRLGRSLPPLASLRDVARRGLMRSYVLYANGDPLAYVIGSQAFDVFHYSDVAFSDQLAKASPGTVLLYHVIRDVCEDRPARWFNFGLGNAEYKRRFANVTTEDVTLMIFRRTFRGHLRALGLKGLDRIRRVGFGVGPMATAWARRRSPEPRLAASTNPDAIAVKDPSAP